MEDDIKQRIREAAARNEELLTIVAETEHAAPDLEQHIRLIGDLEFQVSESDARARELGVLREKELKDHESYQQSAIRRFMFKISGKSSSFDARAAKEEREYFDVLSAEHREKRANQDLRKQLEASRDGMQKLREIIDHHKQAQTELDNLYHSIFAGPSGPAFPEEDQREQEAMDAQRAYHETRSRVECEQQVVKLLQGSIEQMTQARAYMDQALGYSRTDMLHSGAASSLHDMMERNALQNATSAIAAAQNFVAQASRFSPFVQVNTLPPVTINCGNLMADVLFDNIFTDMMFHQEIQRAKGEVDRMATVVKGELSSATQRLSELQGQLNQTERNLASTRKALQDIRAEAFRKVIEETNGGGLQRLARAKSPAC